MAIKAWRSASKGGSYSKESVPVRLRPTGRSGPEPYEVTLNFTIQAGGRGRSDLSVSIRPEDFILLAQAMMDVSPEEAIKAFGMAMITGRQTPLDDELIE